jgi:type IV secretory pathway VirB3-like protein
MEPCHQPVSCELLALAGTTSLALGIPHCHLVFKRSGTGSAHHAHQQFLMAHILILIFQINQILKNSDQLILEIWVNLQVSPSAFCTPKLSTPG